MRRLVNFLVLLGLGVGLIILSPFCYAQNTASFDSKLISVDFKEADLKDVIGILSVMTGLNIALDDDVEGEVTARFEDIPVLQALQMILEINDCQYEILDDIIKVTKIPILTQSFPLEFALVSEVAELIKSLLSPEGSLKVNEVTNTLIITDKKVNLEKIEEAIQEIDSPSLQLDTKVFSFKFIRADKAASLIQDQLSEVGKVEIVLPTNSLQVTDTSYNLTKLEALASSLDIFQPIKKTFTLKFALVSEAAELIRPLLSPEGSLKVSEATNTLVISDKGMNLEKIEEAIQEIDSPSLQLDTKVFSFEFIRTDEAASLIQSKLSEVGKIEAVPGKRLLVSDTKYNLAKLEDFISILDVSQPREEKSFTLKFALVSDVEATLKSDYLNPGDEIIDVNVNKEKNEIVLASNSSTLKKIENYLKELDVPEKNISKKEFSAEYLSLEELADLVRENLSSWGEIVEQDKTENILITKDTSYNLFKIGKVIEEKDVFASLKKTKTYDEIEYASASSLAKKAEDFLSEKGEVVEVDEEKSRFVVEDLEKNLEEIDDLVRSEDTLEAQLTEKKYLLKYLTPQQAKEELRLRNILSEYGQIRLPEAGKEEGVGSGEDKRDYIIIPQEEIDTSEKEESQESEVSPEESDLEEIEKNVIYITVLKKNVLALKQAMKEIDSPFQVITKIFSIPEGSLEAIVVAIATMIGVSPEDIQGIEIGEETEWLKMKVTSPTIGLGDIGAVGKK